MAYGIGQSDLEVRVLALERKAHTPEIPSIEVRLAALEQRQAEPNGSGGPMAGECLRAVTSGAISSGGSGAVTVYDDSGTATARTETARLWLTGMIAPGTKVYIARVNGGWDIVQADCP